MVQFENDDEAFFDEEVFFDVVPEPFPANVENLQPDKTVVPDPKKIESPSVGTESLPRSTHDNEEEYIFEIGPMAGFSYDPQIDKIVISPEKPEPGQATVAAGPSGIVQLVKVAAAVPGRAEKTAPIETEFKAGKTDRTVIPKRQSMDRHLPSRSPDAFKNAGQTPQPQRVPEPPAADPLAFKASVVESLTDSECRIIALKGRIEHGQRAALEEFLDANLPQDGRRVILDMDGLVSMSSSGWGVMVAQLQRLKKSGGSISLCGMHGEVENCFRILDFHALFSAYPSVAEAVQSPIQTKVNFSYSTKTKASSAAPDPSVSPASLPLEEKIKRIVAENPFLGAGRIARLLRSEAYGATKINRWKLQAKLQSMNLGTKQERYRFFRSS